MGGRGHDIGVGERARVDTGRNDAGVVSHIHHQVSADAVSDISETLEIDAERESGSAADDDLRLVFLRETLDLFVVDVFIGIQAVRHAAEVLAGEVEVHAVGEVAARVKRHTHEAVARLHQRELHSHVGLSAGVRLHVHGHLDTSRLAEQLLRAFLSNALNDVDVLAAAVVALARIAFSILVGQLGALSSHNCGGSVVFRRDKFDVVFLAVVLRFDSGPNLRVFGCDGDRLIHKCCPHLKK